jgi:drug/metabolite transporter (DMT)-like permease
MTDSIAKRRRLIGLLLVLLGAFGFSAKAIFIKLAYGISTQTDAITLMALRMAFSLPFFLLVAVWNNKTSSAEPLPPKQWLVIIVLGLMGYYIASFLDFLGLQYISAGLERVILFLYPTFVIVFSALVYRRKITWRVGLALALSYAGMLLVFVEHLATESANVWLGSLLVLASAVVFACFTMGSGVMTPRIGSARFTAYTMTIACIATLVHFAIVHGVDLLGLPKDVYVLAGLMAIFSTVLPAFFMNAGILRIGAGSASIVSTIGPILTLALAFVVLAEPVSYWQLAGTFLVLAGVYTVSKVKA